MEKDVFDRVSFGQARYVMQALEPTTEAQQVTSRIHISFHLCPFDAFLDLYDISQHSTHQILSENDDLLIKVFDSGRIAGEDRLGYLCLYRLNKRLRNWLTW
jgi:hypothetical protein